MGFRVDAAPSYIGRRRPAGAAMRHLRVLLIGLACGLAAYAAILALTALSRRLGLLDWL